MLDFLVGSLTLALKRWLPDHRAALLHSSGMTAWGFVSSLKGG